MSVGLGRSRSGTAPLSSTLLPPSAAGMYNKWRQVVTRYTTCGVQDVILAVLQQELMLTSLPNWSTTVLPTFPKKVKNKLAY